MLQSEGLSMLAGQFFRGELGRRGRICESQPVQLNPVLFKEI